MTRDLLVQRCVGTTMISTHVLNRGGKEMRNLADGL